MVLVEHHKKQEKNGVKDIKMTKGMKSYLSMNTQ